MATSVKTKNGNVGVEAVADIAVEAQAAVDTMLETAAKVNENGLSLLNAQQKVVKDSFEMWQKYNQTTFDFFVEATQKTFAQSLAFRRELDKVLENNFKQAQELFTNEQKLALEAAETVQAQFQAATERVNGMFAPVLEK